jgi:hypothetical protein
MAWTPPSDAVEATTAPSTGGWKPPADAVTSSWTPPADAVVAEKEIPLTLIIDMANDFTRNAHGINSRVECDFIAQDDSDLALLMAYDSDSFNRWDASNRLSTKVILDLVKHPLSEISSSTLPPHYVDAVRTTLVS